MIQKYSSKKNSIIKIFYFVLFISILYLSFNLCIFYGALKERKDKNCIKASELILWENTLKTAHSICVDVQQNQLSEIKSNYENRVNQAEEEAKKWKEYYLYQKKINNKEKQE